MLGDEGLDEERSTQCEATKSRAERGTSRHVGECQCDPRGNPHKEVNQA